ncbi:MAG: hypothetical protein RIQ99_2103 [Pseudomonadota bacterium]|jgi:hypothetical protein
MTRTVTRTIAAALGLMATAALLTACTPADPAASEPLARAEAAAARAEAAAKRAEAAARQAAFARPAAASEPEQEPAEAEPAAEPADGN